MSMLDEARDRFAAASLRPDASRSEVGRSPGPLTGGARGRA